MNHGYGYCGQMEQTDFTYMNFWGKADEKSGTWHPLVFHMLDVAAVAREVLLREPERSRQLYAQDLGFSNFDETLPGILFFVALHDVGKATPSFQKMCEKALPSHKKQLFSVGLKWANDINYIHHGELGQILFRKEIQKFISIPEILLQHVTQAVNAHHGFLKEASQKCCLIEAGLKPIQIDWQNARHSMIQALSDLLLSNAARPPVESLTGSAYMRLAGLTSFADWIGSDTEHFKYFNEQSVSLGEPDLAQYWMNAQQSAKTALDHIGWVHRKSLYESIPSFDTVFPDKMPRPLQSAVIDMLYKTEGPQLILVEAPMGEGKTEAAFYAHLLLQQSAGHRGMYVALPSQATGNAMFRRTVEFLKGTDRELSVDLQLLHGSALLNDDYQKLKIGGIHEDPEELKKSKETPEVVAHEWFTNKKRALLSEYGVGTVDQALLSVLNVKHRFVRLWGLGNRTIVIDEVHAYDVYTSTILDRLLMWLKALGSSVILMSATLPEKRRKELLNTWGAKVIQKVDYPRVTSVNSSDIVSPIHFPADKSRERTLQIQPAPVAVSELAQFALDKVKDGGCLAIIVNTVQRAQDLYKEIDVNKKDIDIYIFHARFPAELRKEREDNILSLFGKDADPANPRPVKAILVATQVVEQSLDIDFDVMISDLAPIDLLLQRAGRIHRHIRSPQDRYGHSDVRLYVSGMGGEELPEIDKPLFWSYVYEPYILYRTWIILGKQRIIKLPQDMENVIEEVYDDRRLPAPWADSTIIQKAKEELDEVVKADRAQVTHGLLAEPIRADCWSINSGFEKDEEERPDTHPKQLAKTRKGDRSITAILLFKQANAEDSKIYLDEFYNKEVFLDHIPDLELTKAIYSNSVSLSRWDIVHSLKGSDVPIGWKKNPLLRNCRPLIFNGKMSQVGDTIIHFSKETGIYYETKEK